MKFSQRLFRNHSGATAIEYGLIAALIAVAAITAMGSLGGQLSSMFGGVNDKVRQANSAQN
jgi:pilus assembly protein Flp/PilA